MIRKRDSQRQNARVPVLLVLPPPAPPSRWPSRRRLHLLRCDYCHPWRLHNARPGNLSCSSLIRYHCLLASQPQPGAARPPLGRRAAARGPSALVEIEVGGRVGFGRRGRRRGRRQGDVVTWRWLVGGLAAGRWCGVRCARGGGGRNGGLGRRGFAVGGGGGGLWHIVMTGFGTYTSASTLVPFGKLERSTTGQTHSRRSAAISSRARCSSWSSESSDVVACETRTLAGLRGDLKFQENHDISLSDWLAYASSDPVRVPLFSFAAARAPLTASRAWAIRPARPPIRSRSSCPGRYP